jgi:hypothetical protein
MPHHSHRRAQPATSSRNTSAYAMSQTTTTPTRYLTANNKRARHVTTANDPEKRRNRRVGARRMGKGVRKRRRGNQQAGGNGGGRGRPFVPPLSLFFRSRSQRDGVKTTRRFVRARLSPPRYGGEFLSQRGRVNATRCPRFFSFLTGAAYSRCPPFFQFRTGAA